MATTGTPGRRVVAVAVACATLVAGAAVWLVATDQLRPRAVPFTAELAARTVADLTSGDPARVQQAIAWPDGEAVDPEIVAGLAASQLTVDSGTFRDGGDGVATVRGTLRTAEPQSEPAPYTFYLVQVDGRWHFFDGLADEPAAGQAPQRPAPLVAARAATGAAVTRWTCQDSTYGRAAINWGGADEQDDRLDGVEVRDLPTGVDPNYLPAGVTPVILVHGWTGTSAGMSTIASALAPDIGSAVAVYEFDYTGVNDVWAGHASVAGCLAAYIDHVAALATPRRKVIVVGHSMGGLAVRYASTTRIGERNIANDLAGVVTLDTPHLGSPWGGTILADIRSAATRLGRWDLSAWPDPQRGAARCLAQRQPGGEMVSNCGAAPPYLPAGVPVYQIAGEISIGRTFLFWGQSSTNLHSDGVVATSSQLGYDESGPAGTRAPRWPENGTARCTVSQAAVLAKAVSFGEPVWRAYVGTWGLVPLAGGYLTVAEVPRAVATFMAASCGHTNILTSSTAVDAVVSAVRELR